MPFGVTTTTEESQQLGKAGEDPEMTSTQHRDLGFCAAAGAVGTGQGRDGALVAGSDSFPSSVDSNSDRPWTCPTKQVGNVLLPSTATLPTTAWCPRSLQSDPTSG